MRDVVESRSPRRHFPVIEEEGCERLGQLVDQAVGRAHDLGRPTWRFSLGWPGLLSRRGRNAAPGRRPGADILHRI